MCPHRRNARLQVAAPSGIHSKGPGFQTWAFLLVAPLLVVLPLLLARNVWTVFALYQVGCCLVFPAIINVIVNRKSFREHLADLGIFGPSRQALLMGGTLAVLSGGLLLLLNSLYGGWFFAANQVEQVLAMWSVRPHQYLAVAVFMALINGPAEELYWRGFLHSRLQGQLAPGRAFGLTSVCYASYHGVTVYLLLASVALSLMVVLLIGCVGYFWAWLREKTGSVWPALLMHSAVTWAYVFIWYSLEGRP